MGKGLTSFLSCKHPKTTSFRDNTGHTLTITNAGTIYKTMNSMYLDNNVYSEEEEIDTSSSIDEIDHEIEIDDDEECLIPHSDRLFFEPSSTSCSILEKSPNYKEGVLLTENKNNNNVPFKESFLLAMESTDPYKDFRVSMEEMVAAHGLTDWTRLEELLVWYLRVNGEKNHAFIIQAFVDLLVGLAPISTTTTSEEEESSNSSGVTLSSCITFDEAEGSESNTN